MGLLYSDGSEQAVTILRTVLSVCGSVLNVAAYLVRGPVSSLQPSGQ